MCYEALESIPAPRLLFYTTAYSLLCNYLQTLTNHIHTRTVEALLSACLLDHFLSFVAHLDYFHSLSHAATWHKSTKKNIILQTLLHLDVTLMQPGWNSYLMWEVHDYEWRASSKLKQCTELFPSRGGRELVKVTTSIIPSAWNPDVCIWFWIDFHFL